MIGYSSLNVGVGSTTLLGAHMAQTKEITGPTPAGGVRAVAHFMNDENELVDEGVATKVRIIEYDKDGHGIMSTLGYLGSQPGPAANVYCATGPGGGIDPTCKKGGSGAGRQQPTGRQSGPGLLRAPLDDSVTHQVLADWLEEEGRQQEADELRNVDYATDNYLMTRLGVGIEGATSVKMTRSRPGGIGFPQYNSVGFASKAGSEQARWDVKERLTDWGFWLANSTRDNHTGAVEDIYHLVKGDQHYRIRILTERKGEGPRLLQTLHKTPLEWYKERPHSFDVADLSPPAKPVRLVRRRGLGD